MNRIQKIPYLPVAAVLLALTMMCCTAIPLVGAISTATGYAGKCYGFTDSVSDCPWYRFTLNEIFFAVMFATPLLFLLGFSWGGLAGWALVSRTWTHLVVSQPRLLGLGWLKLLAGLGAVLVAGLLGAVIFYYLAVMSVRLLDGL